MNYFTDIGYCLIISFSNNNKFIVFIIHWKDIVSCNSYSLDIHIPSIDSYSHMIRFKTNILYRLF